MRIVGGAINVAIGAGGLHSAALRGGTLGRADDGARVCIEGVGVAAAVVMVIVGAIGVGVGAGKPRIAAQVVVLRTTDVGRTQDVVGIVLERIARLARIPPPGGTFSSQLRF